MNVLLFIYGYICAVVAYEVPACPLRGEQWCLVNAGEEAAVTTGSAKESQCALV